MFIDQGGLYPIAIHKKLLRAISPKIGICARAIKSSRGHVCASAEAIASDRSHKTKRPVILCNLSIFKRKMNVIFKMWLGSMRKGSLICHFDPIRFTSSAHLAKQDGRGYKDKRGGASQKNSCPQTDHKGTLHEHKLKPLRSIYCKTCNISNKQQKATRGFCS